MKIQANQWIYHLTWRYLALFQQILIQCNNLNLTLKQLVKRRQNNIRIKQFNIKGKIFNCYIIIILNFRIKLQRRIKKKIQKIRNTNSLNNILENHWLLQGYQYWKISTLLRFLHLKKIYKIIVSKFSQLSKSIWSLTSKLKNPYIKKMIPLKYMVLTN